MMNLKRVSSTTWEKLAVKYERLDAIWAAKSFKNLLVLITTLRAI